MDVRTQLKKKGIRYEVFYYGKSRSFLPYFLSFFKKKPSKELKTTLFSLGKDNYALLTLKGKKIDIKKVKAQLGKGAKKMPPKKVKKTTGSMPLSLSLFSLPKNVKLRVDNGVFGEKRVLLPSQNLFYGFEIETKDLEKIRPFEVVAL
jgi:prolyl-tRNA editing enzyme YbaK/EbsC (Cys-tRNA(Pro) deacylase)